VEILAERVMMYEEVQLYQGHSYVRLPRALRTPDEKLYELLRSKWHVEQLKQELQEALTKKRCARVPRLIKGAEN
jgi:hypothetical protein